MEDVMNLLVKLDNGMEYEYTEYAIHNDEFGNKVILVPLDDGRFKIASQDANDCYYSVLYFDNIQSVKLVGNHLYK